MQVLNALDLKKGAKAERNRMGTITQPLQFLPREEKDEMWAAHNMDWLEWNGMRQISRSARRLLKNYKLAKGIIDKTDYIVEEDNEMRELIDVLVEDDPTAFDLKFYPIVPNVINVMVSEFAKRNTQVSFRSVDEFAYNEMLDQKMSAIKEVLYRDASQKMMNNLLEMGADINDPAIQEQMNQQMSPQALQTLPQIHEFYTKSYRSLAEEWATHQMEVDQDRFKLEELEQMAFRDSLITDRAFFHFAMGEEDYNIELWNPVTTFYHKSPEVRYISQGNWVGKIEMLTVADIIDKFGYLLTADQAENLQTIYPVKAMAYGINGTPNDGSFYDATRSHDWNVNLPSLAMRQFSSVHYNYHGGDIMNWINAENEDFQSMPPYYFMRVTTAYWKSQRKVGLLTQVDDNGEVDNDIVDEDFVVTVKPAYNTTLNKNKTKQNLIHGQHIDWVYINEVWGGIKIGPNRPTVLGMENPDGFSPIYIGIDSNEISPVKFQFKGDNDLYGCKLPVEGAVFSDRNTRSTSFLDLTKPFQIGYNMVNNQIQDILVDEIGSVVILDQNTLPKHSLNGDWQKDAYANAYVAMKNFQMLPLDTSMQNTEVPTNFQHFTTLNLEQTNRLLSRINLANYFKQQLYESLGFTPQRLGMQLSQTDTAKGVEQAVVGSYAQTEGYFINFCDHLLPRVHQMRTDLSQYYQSTKPSVRLQYTTTTDERINFQINGTELLLADINVYATTKINQRDLIEQMRQLAKSNNTSGATIYDLGDIIQAQSLGEIRGIMKNARDAADQKLAEERAHEEKLAQIDAEQKTQEEKMKLDYASMEKEKDRRTELLVAEIKAAGYGAMMDINQNQQSDFQDVLNQIQKTDQFRQTMDAGKEKNQIAIDQHRDRMNLEYDKLRNQKEMKDVDLQIARENQTKAELVSKGKKVDNSKKK